MVEVQDLQGFKNLEGLEPGGVSVFETKSRCKLAAA